MEYHHKAYLSMLGGSRLGISSMYLHSYTVLARERRTGIRQHVLSAAINLLAGTWSEEIGGVSLLVLGVHRNVRAAV